MARTRRPLTVLCDMDGVAADFNSLCWERSVEAGLEFDVPTLEHVQHYYITDHLVDQSRRQELRDIVNAPGFFADLAPMPGAVEGLHRLASHPDVKLWICTKPLEANPTCRDDKGRWLRRYFGDLDLEHKMICAPNKAMIRGDILLDDAPVPEQAAKATWQVVLFESAWHPYKAEYAELPTWSWDLSVEDLLQHRPEPEVW